MLVITYLISFIILNYILINLSLLMTAITKLEIMSYYMMYGLDYKILTIIFIVLMLIYYKFNFFNALLFNYYW